MRVLCIDDRWRNVGLTEYPKFGNVYHVCSVDEKGYYDLEEFPPCAGYSLGFDPIAFFLLQNQKEKLKTTSIMKKITALFVAMTLFFTAIAQSRTDTAKVNTTDGAAKKSDTTFVPLYQKIDTARHKILIYMAKDGNVKHYDDGGVVQQGFIRFNEKGEASWVNPPVPIGYVDAFGKAIDNVIQAFEPKPKPVIKKAVKDSTTAPPPKK